jgi:hypothetical protein
MRGPRLRLVALGVPLLALSACGGTTELTQEQTAEVLLSAEEFPLDGFTRGEVQQNDPSEGDGVAEDDTLAALLEGQDVPEACMEALEATNLGGDNLGAQSMVTFTQGDQSAPLPTTVELVVATVDGDSPLEPLARVNDECSEVTVEEGGMSMTMSFEELEDLEGTKMTVALGEVEVDLLMGGTMDGDVVVAGFGTGVGEKQLTDVIETQVDKLDDVD